MIRLICLAVGYLFGLIQTSYIYGRMQGIDIRTQGSGNAGTTNALRVLGKKAGAITFVGDACKCIAAILLVRLFFPGAIRTWFRFSVYIRVQEWFWDIIFLFIWAFGAERGLLLLEV